MADSCHNYSIGHVTRTCPKAARKTRIVVTKRLEVVFLDVKSKNNYLPAVVQLTGL